MGKVNKPKQKADILEPWIIEQIKREEDQRRPDNRPTIEVPKDNPEYQPEYTPGIESPKEEEKDRGVVIIDFQKGKK